MLASVLVDVDIFQFNSSYREVPHICGDDQQLKLAFFNIIQNGIDAVPTGGILKVNINPSDEYLRIHVIDQGVGIAEDSIQKLGEVRHTTKKEGFGLGLTLAYKIIEQPMGNPYQNWAV
jgi:two-component system, sporulation sensor kinase E